MTADGVLRIHEKKRVLVTVQMLIDASIHIGQSALAEWKSIASHFSFEFYCLDFITFVDVICVT